MTGAGNEHASALRHYFVDQRGYARAVNGNRAGGGGDAGGGMSIGHLATNQLRLKR
jgi:hypothetical protein